MSLPPLFADECCPAQVVRILRAAGCDIVYVIETGAGRTDVEQAREAYRQGRVLLSADYDFGELAIRHGEAFAGLVLLAPDLHLEQPDQASVIATRLLALGDSVLGRLTNLGAETMRQREL